MTNKKDHRKEDHNTLVRDACGHMPDDDTTRKLSDFFSVLSDPTRLRILWAIGEEEVCVCCISEALGMSVSAVSHQLRTLRQARLVKARREGRNIYYSLDDRHIKTMLDNTLEHMEE
jgi:ArsR family transcriptional regulator